MRFTIVETKIGNQTIIPGKFYLELDFENKDRNLYLGAVDKTNACLVAISVKLGTASISRLPNLQSYNTVDSDMIQVKPELTVHSIYEANEFCNVIAGALFEKDNRKYLKILRYSADGGVDFETGEFVKFEPGDLVIELDASLSIKLID